MQNYERIRKIGQGSFGRIYLIRDIRDGEEYCLKEVEMDMDSEPMRKQALAEAKFLKDINHPNIISVLEYFVEDDMLYMIMEYAAGGDLDTKIKEQKEKSKEEKGGDELIYFSEDQIMKWLVQICFALKHIHDRRILHRDIKTPNMFLTKDNIIKLGDFGVARVLENTLDQAKTQIGTPYYLSPELCRNEPYGHKSDMWALGVVLYEVTSLCRPFEGSNILALVNGITTQEPDAIPTEYSFDLRAVINCLLAKKPNQRPSVNTVLIFPFLRPWVDAYLKDFKEYRANEEPEAAQATAAPTYSCGTCNKPFVEGDTCVEAEGMDYHPSCLRCSVCDRSIAEEGYILRQGERYCSGCEAQITAMAQQDTEWTCQCGSANHGYQLACVSCKKEQNWEDEQPMMVETSTLGGDMAVSAVESLISRNPIDLTNDSRNPIDLTNDEPPVDTKQMTHAERARHRKLAKQRAADERAAALMSAGRQQFFENKQLASSNRSKFTR